MSFFYILAKVRNIIGIVKTTMKHTSDSIQQVAELGQHAFTLFLEMFDNEEVQPYLFAMCIELCVQLQHLLEHCDSLRIDLNTTQINAQQSELLNKMLKNILYKMSRRKHSTGPVVEDHYQSECALGFIHEYITKEVALQLGMEVQPAETQDKQLFMPQGQECKLCLIDLKDDANAHDFICKHPLLEDVKQMGATGARRPRF